MADRSLILLSSLIWLLTFFVGYSHAQSQNAVGAHRFFPKTSFSCIERPTGYYADIETGCQVYHMCDELGRQFSYSCPNTTLFQQRMLICDHWYMVNCSKAESDYTANLLIGQRDKPFVGEEENHLRTPRPDLLDRPYAPDYSGESYRNQYKSLPAIQNRIVDSDQRKESGNKYQPDPPATSTHWKIPKPNREILPPADNSFHAPSSTTHAVRHVQSTTTPRQSNVFTEKTKQHQKFPSSIKRRKDDDDAYDLGTSHSIRYNTTDDISSAEDRKLSTSKLKSFASQVKTPSLVYEPPFFHSIYDQNVQVPIDKPFRTSTAKPFVPLLPLKTSTAATTTKQPSTRPTRLSGQPFLNSNKADDSNLLTKKLDFSKQSSFATSTASSKENEIKVAPSAQAFRPQSNLIRAKTTTTSNPVNSVQLPANDLLPPHEAIIFHYTGTTEGPPIYYEWKIPSNGLLPPKLDLPIGDKGLQESENLTNVNLKTDQFQFSSTTQKSIGNSPFLNSLQRSASELSTSRAPISRSIKDNSQLPGRNNLNNDSSQKKLSSGPTTEPNILQLRKDFLIPDYIFPLESIGRTGYIPNSNTLNSFRLKIANGQSSIFDNENPNCPQCHPTFVKLGTCEPCVRR